MQRTRKDARNPERRKTYHGTKRCKTCNVCEWRETCNEWQRREKRALGTRRKNTWNLCNSVASVKYCLLLLSARSHVTRLTVYTMRIGKPGMTGDMKPDSNEEKPITVDSREFIFRENSLNVVQRYYILGIFIGRKKRRVLHKTRPK